MGLWTARIRVNQDADGSLEYELLSFLPVKQIGDSVAPGLQSTVRNLFVCDQLAKAPGQTGDHQLAFVASTAGGNVLLRALYAGAPPASGRVLEIVGP